MKAIPSSLLPLSRRSNYEVQTSRQHAYCQWSRLALAGMVLLGLGGCRRTSTQHVKIDGSSTVYPITEAIAEEFQQVSPTIRVTVGISGTGGGFKKFSAGETDICDASRRIKESESEACRAAGIEPIELSVAFDGIAIVVHPDNNWIDSITVEQLKQLWQPESSVHKWSDLNPDWPDEKITLYGPGTDSGTFDYFTEKIIGESGASRADYTASEDDNVIVRGVTADRHALGYFGFAYYAENKDHLKLLAVDAGDGPVRPSEETIRDGTYKPLSRPLFIYVRKDALARPEVEQFVRFYLDHVNEIVREVGYVPISDDVAAENQRRLEQALSADASAADGP